MSVIEIPSGSLPSKASDHRQWHCHEELTGLVVLEVAAQHDGTVLLIAKDNQHAHQLEAELKFYQTGQNKPLPVNTFVDWETLPYDLFSPHEDLVSTRLKLLSALPSLTSGIVICSLSNAIQKIPPRAFIDGSSFVFKCGETFDPESQRQKLDSVGYRNVNTVYEHGEYALRGSIFDVFPMGSELPVRIELFDDEIDSLRTFDPETQRSVDKLTSIELLPACEYPWDEGSRRRFRNNWLDVFPNAPSNLPILRDIKDGIQPHGIEYYTPLFFEEMATIFDYLGENTLVIAPADVSERAQKFQSEVFERFEDRRHDIQRPILTPNKLYQSVEELFSQQKQFPGLRIDTSPAPKEKQPQSFTSQKMPAVAIDDRADEPTKDLKQALDKVEKSLLIVESVGRREVLGELLQREGLTFSTIDNWDEALASKEPLLLGVGLLGHGFVLPEKQLQVFTETELYGQRVQQTRRRKKSQDSNEFVVKNLTELQIGSPVVHIDHGVGRYRGLESITLDGMTNEFLMLEYANEAKLYVPVSSLQLISRYSGTEEALAPLHKLGTEKWSIAKKKAMEKIHDTAAELLEVYAKREAKKGIQYLYPGEDYRRFAAQFPFEETPDQENAINAVIQDMTKEKPMDRLVCGDVGFGKTEVAMRAAFIATHNSKQVAMLVPTTLLAQQHYESFVDRFADTPVKVGLLSRFQSTKEQNQVLAEVEQGKVDIVVGTHKIIQGDLKFKNLGLLIIDEEHRFGVQQKEKLKTFRSDVDILTMTATPIPRTLNMAMGGIRDLSIIATPPAKRLSVKTFIREREDALIREAALREILRGGQVYYLFNDVKNIEKEVAYLQELLPEARVGFAHGQMRERELEQSMSDFYHMRYNVLVCSTIIETGIDIPNANTIIINRADKFGLAQLHQLRGRVGRSHHQAYAYLMIPAAKTLSKDAEKRLEAIEASQDLGAGFMLATHDLEIRGAGELLGEDQSGQIQNIGFSLYMELLEKAVDSLNSGKTLSLEDDNHGCEVQLSISAILPDDFIPDVHTRLILYKRISNAKNKDELEALQVELVDRFGLLPDPCKNLFRQTQLKLNLEPFGIRKLQGGLKQGEIEFDKDTSVDPMAIVTLVQTRPDLYQMKGATNLKFDISANDADQMFTKIEQFTAQLTKSS